ncbi:putative L-aspartate dehydrogenase isoform X2 [Lingula anatina]|uniref:Aspartate dehydrogenase domain-containing protein n=1 Tax=Lingula anatina TaxID=7574 RepID=A0A1S3K2P3_LINAN|nr:putative L-aspartate dehydrogenase isoform X2 [Lingula anatina]|eukprot:XP_013416669.1 putative L-aspartate dehydrogenase isoform X2 [Lingula anatina]
MDKCPCKVGVVGFGHLGQYLVDAIQARSDLELAFVWNRTIDVVKGKLDNSYILEDLSQFATRNADLIVEVAHPSISKQYGSKFLQCADYMVGSPTALADQEVETELRNAAKIHGLYIPSGAFWGGEDIKKMADRGSLQGLKVTMKKHPQSFKLHGKLRDLNDTVKTEAAVLYDGPVRDLCPLAPNNVNTMAVAAIAAYNLGFDQVQGCLVSDPSLTDWHIVEVDVFGPGDMKSGTCFQVNTSRKNPSKLGAVTGTATYASFLSSLLGARGKGAGTHLC